MQLVGNGSCGFQPTRFVLYCECCSNVRAMISGMRHLMIAYKLQPISIDDDEYVAVGQHIVNVGLTL